MNTVIARLKRDDRGWTLVELLVAMFIMGIIIAAVANALIVGFTTSDDTSKRFAESHDAQIASATLAKDVQNAASITSATNAVCGAGALIAFSQDGTTPAIGYYYGVAPNGETQVMRRQCDGTGSQVLAHFAATSGAPTITCDGIACNPGSRPKPNVVQISVTEQSGYVFNVLGARRRWACAGGSDCGQPQPAKVNVLVLALGPGPSPGLFIGGSQSGLIVNGSLMVNSSSATAVTTGGCTACINVRDTAKILQGGGCSGCTSSNTVPAYPSGWGNYPSAIPDPLLFLPYPSKTAQPINPAPTNGGTLFHPGVYTTPLQINNKANNTLEAGVYILEQGMSITANGTHVTGSGVMLFNTCQNTGSCAVSPVCSDTVQAPSSPATGGDIWVAGQSNLTLSPPATGLYNGVVLFQDRTSTHCINLSGQSDVSSIDGTLYARTSYLVTLGAGHAGMSVYSIIAPNLMISGQAKVTVGPTS